VIVGRSKETAVRDKSLDVNLRGRELILRDTANKSVAWLDKFKQIGDVAVNFGQHLAALPWDGVRLLL
jgi:hypothetical protein